MVIAAAVSNGMASGSLISVRRAGMTRSVL